MLKRGFVVFSDCLCCIAMEWYSKEQRVLIVKTHYQNDEHYAVTAFGNSVQFLDITMHGDTLGHEFTRTKSEMSWNSSQKFVVSSTNLMRQCDMCDRFYGKNDRLRG